MFLLLLSEINAGIYSSLPAGEFYNTTPVGIQCEFFYGKRYLFSNISYYIFISPTYKLGIIENGYGIYFDFLTFKTGLSFSYFYYYRNSKLKGFEDGFSILFSLFVKKYFRIGDNFISINLKMNEVYDEPGFDIYNIGISFGMF